MFKIYKNAFTLSEVLITLGVIGVVAAMTIPTLIQSYRNHVVETRLKKVYSVMNQAIQRAEADYGAKELWDYGSIDLFEKYFAPYIKVLKIETQRIGSTKYRKIYFTDGSLLLNKNIIISKDKEGNETETVLPEQQADFFFYPNAKNFNEEKFTDRSDSGISFFYFRFAPFSNAYYHKNKGFQPYAIDLHESLDNLTKNDAKFSCNKESRYHGYCAFYIMQNGWKIPKDYPFKVK